MLHSLTSAPSSYQGVSGLTRSPPTSYTHTYIYVCIYTYYLYNIYLSSYTYGLTSAPSSDHGVSGFTRSPPTASPSSKALKLAAQQGVS